MHEDTKGNDLQEIITQAIEDMKKELGEKFDLQHLNLAELQRRTGLSRSRLRTLKKNNFKVTPHGRTGLKAASTVLSGYTSVVDNALRNGVRNSEVIYDRISELGYTGSRSTLKHYISEHLDLIPARRHLIAPQSSRGRRYSTGPGESYQMDWGFVRVETAQGENFRVACFAMICHHCGQRYVEFFPNAKQENLFIGMLHAFAYLGVPESVLTDNMKSVVIRRDEEGHPVWQKDYEVFMKAVGFRTILCRPYHPFTKGKVERLIRFVKENFLSLRTFSNITDLNFEAFRWCAEQNGRYHKAVDCIPSDIHALRCMGTASVLEMTDTLYFYLCPLRRITFDGFVNYEGRRFGVPYYYTEKLCRVRRHQFTIYILSTDLKRELARHDVTWSRRDSFCRDQYVSRQPEEHPSSPVKITLQQAVLPLPDSGFEKFNFEEGLWDE